MVQLYVLVYKYFEIYSSHFFGLPIFSLSNQMPILILQLYHKRIYDISKEFYVPYILSVQKNARSISQSIYKLEHTIVPAELNKSHNADLLKITPYKKWTLLRPIYSQSTYQKLFVNKMFQIPLENNQCHWDIINHINIFKSAYVLFKR